MPEVSINVEFYCGLCGAPICHNATLRASSGYTTVDNPTFDITPCDSCLDTAREEGNEAGHEAGKKEGYDEGYENGKSDAEAEVNE